jgi:SAM-dependent MidA family methyltransferase
MMRIIEQAGPLKISDFFALCLADPDHGYYQAASLSAGPATSSPLRKSRSFSAR